MKYIRCPDRLTPEDLRGDSLFLAGGISGCPDWQEQMRSLLEKERLVIVNPRRLNFDKSVITDKEQISWEREHLHNCNLISFWFPKETVCPITLFEFGYWLHYMELFPDCVGYKKIFVGADKEYSRRSDIFEQMELSYYAREAPKIANSVEELTKQIKNHLLPF